MKKRMTLAAGFMTLTLVLIIGSAGPVFAQYSGPIHVSVPFSFVIENEHFQPGDYTIGQASNHYLRIHDKDGKVMTTFLALPAQRNATPGQGSIVFRRYGNDYFLAKIWTPSMELGWEALKGKLEAEIAKNSKEKVQIATLTIH